MASSSKIGTATATWNLIVTNHLGTQVYALTSAGAQHWIGGFEPFGQDYQQGTGQDSLTKGLFLRLPGQWDDTLLAGATLGADVFYNVHRWYEPQTGKYVRPNPFWGAVTPSEYSPLSIVACQTCFNTGRLWSPTTTRDLSQLVSLIGWDSSVTTPVLTAQAGLGSTREGSSTAQSARV